MSEPGSLIFYFCIYTNTNDNIISKQAKFDLLYECSITK